MSKFREPNTFYNVSGASEALLDVCVINLFNTVSIHPLKKLKIFLHLSNHNVSREF